MRFAGLAGRRASAHVRWIMASYGRHSYAAPEDMVATADWLYALRAVKVQYGYLDEDLNDLHRRAQALRSSGSGTLLPQPYSANERALSRMLDQD